MNGDRDQPGSLVRVLGRGVGPGFDGPLPDPGFGGSLDAGGSGGRLGNGQRSLRSSGRQSADGGESGGPPGGFFSGGGTPEATASQADLPLVERSSGLKIKLRHAGR